MGIEPVAISVDTPEAIAASDKTYEVPFPVLSDPDLKSLEAYKVVHALDDPTAERLASFGISLEAWSKRKHKKIAIPSLFLIDRDKTIRFAHAAHDYKTRPDTEALLAALRKIVQPDAGAPGSSAPPPAD
jgi:peroxiredoxin